MFPFWLPLTGCGGPAPLLPEPPDPIGVGSRSIPDFYPDGDFAWNLADDQLTITIAIGPDPAAAALKSMTCTDNEEDWSEEERIRYLAEDLAATLNAIPCGAEPCATFVVDDWVDGQPEANTILLGRPGDFGLDPQSLVVGGGQFFVAEDMFHREQYGFRPFVQPPEQGSQDPEHGFLILGVNALSVEQAAWWFAEQLGYRYLLPWDDWEILPTVPTLSSTQVGAHWYDPDRDTTRRTMVARYLEDTTNQAPRCLSWRRWHVRNGFRKGFKHTQAPSQVHAYLDFDEPGQGGTPSWLDDNPDAVSNGNGANAPHKFCIDYVGTDTSFKDQFWNWILCDLDVGNCDNHGSSLHHTKDMVIVNPGDGWDWWTCTDPQEGGGPTPTDRQLNLANDVATRLHGQDAPPGAPPLVNSQVYASISKPPIVEIPDANVHLTFHDYTVSNFEKRGANELIDAWRVDPDGTDPLGAPLAAGSDVSTYLYFIDGEQLPGSPSHSIGEQWDKIGDLMGRQDVRVRALRIERSGGWLPMGPALLSTMRRATRGPESVDAAKEAFFGAAFPSSETHVRQLFALLDRDVAEPLLSADLVAALYTVVDRALQATTDAGELERIGDLIRYVRHVDLVVRYKEAEAAQAGSGDALAVWEHAYLTDKVEGRWVLDFDQLVVGTADRPTQADIGGWGCGTLPCYDATDYRAWIAAGTDDTNDRLKLAPPGTTTDPVTRYATALNVSARFPLGDLARPRDLPVGYRYDTDNVIRTERRDAGWRLWLDPAYTTALVLTAGTRADLPSFHQGMVKVTITKIDDPAAWCEIEVPPNRRDYRADLRTTDPAITPTALSGPLLAQDFDTADTGMLFDAMQPSIACSGLATGFYELEVENVGPELGLELSVNASTGDPHFVHYEVPDQGVGLFADDLLPPPSRSFYVPVGTEEVVLWAPDGCTLNFGNGESPTPPASLTLEGFGFKVVPTLVGTTDRSGEAWQLGAGCTRQYLINVPPITWNSYAKAGMMVPCDLPCEDLDTHLDVHPEDCPGSPCFP